jgi:hypothetical protein
MRVAGFVQAAILLLAWPVAAQVRYGDFSSNLSGTIASGYTADYGNMTGSDHSWTVGGAASSAGSFYNPNFLSYNANFYLNQSNANSNFQSISNASGIDVSTSLFGGGHFPGSVTYSKGFNKEGNYAVPGIADYVTHGNNQDFGINWSENVPDKPSLSVGFQTGTGNYSVYGTDDDGLNSFHSFNARSGYNVAGFNMAAYYSNGAGHALIPEVVAGIQDTETHSNSSSEGFNIGHPLPLQGSFSGGLNRSNWGTDYLGSSSSGTIDILNAQASVHPRNALSLTGSINYSDNLSGQLFESVVAAGGVAPQSDDKSDSLDINALCSYSPLRDLQTSLFYERRTQSFLGENYGVNSYGGGAAYSRKIPGGIINTSLTITANSSDNTGEDTLGLSTAENYSGEFKGWHVTGSFAYTQNAQTLLVTYMNSYFNYSGNVRRRWGKFSVGAGAGAGQTALSSQAGTTSTSQSYTASFGYDGLINATGSYSKASGQALATGGGLVPVPIPSPILPSSLISLYGGNSLSFAVTSSPVKNLTLAAAYAKAASNTSSDAVTSTNDNSQYNALIQYQIRKLNFISGYSRLQQSFSTSGTQPETVSSFYVGVSRWFNFF